MNQQRILDMVQRIANIAEAREAVEAIFVALKRFEQKSRHHNRRHLATPSPTPEEWAGIYAEVEPYARELARALAAYRDAYSIHLTAVLDGTAGLIDEAAAYGIDPHAILRQFRVQEALEKIDRVPSKLNVFLYSWGRQSLEEYQGEQMKRAIEHAACIEREASYLAGYLARLLDRGGIADDMSGER